MSVITELIQQYPRGSLILIAFAISFGISMVNYLVLDKEKMKEIKAKQKKLQGEIMTHQKSGNHGKAMELQKEMLSHSGEMLKHSFKPMIITMIPILIVFGLIRNVYATTVIASSWFWYYLIAAIASSMIFRKVLGLP